MWLRFVSLICAITFESRVNGSLYFFAVCAERDFFDCCSFSVRRNFSVRRTDNSKTDLQNFKFLPRFVGAHG